VNVPSPDTINVDAGLIRRAQAGDASAFGQLVTKYQDRVYNLCYRMCHDSTEALDMAQAAFVKAFERLDSFREQASFYTWLFRIAVNTVISERRKSARRKTLSLDREDGAGQPMVERIEGNGGGVGQRIEAAERRTAIEQALQRLDEEFRVVVVLKDIEQMDYATIAGILDVPVGTVKSRLHRGRLSLRAYLVEAGVVDG
jgi:RNA polymerase sigma-70 factor (ECF subfamily)